jgi:soluble lytic murein transglycosylase-like protein
MAQVIVALLLAGLMGALGQGIRAIIGLKQLADQNANMPPGSGDVFQAARLAVSLMIGFMAGALSGLALLDQLIQVSSTNHQILFGLIAAGYAGTDAIEGFISAYLPDGDQAAKPAANLASSLQSVSNQVATLHQTVTALSAKTTGSVPGTDYPAWALKRDINEAKSKFWQFLTNSAAKYNLPISVVCAVGSKESAWGLLLKPPGPGGTGDFTPRNLTVWKVAMPSDNLGWGRGLMQIDWGSHDFAKTGNWQDPAVNIDYGCGLLSQYIDEFRKQGIEDISAIRSGVARYNGQTWPHSPYSDDVMARADWIVQQKLDETLAAVA